MIADFIIKHGVLAIQREHPASVDHVGHGPMVFQVPLHIFRVLTIKADHHPLVRAFKRQHQNPAARDR